MLAIAAEEILLQNAEHHVTAAEWRILCQLQQLEQMRRDGVSTRAAEAVLETLRCGRDAWTAHRSKIINRMRPVAQRASAA